MRDETDILIIGSGMGGATLAAALASGGRKIMILERGERLVDNGHCRDDRAIFGSGIFRPDETWHTDRGEDFNPGNYYYVGGNTKFYGAVMARFRREDFGEIRHLGGVSPAWPVDYDEMEPWYQAAEEMYGVRGAAEEDPTEPPHGAPYPEPPVPDEPAIAALRPRLARAGVTPSSLPLAVDHLRWLERARTPWDAFPDTTGAKRDAENVGIARALEHANVELVTGARVTRLVADKNGRIIAADYDRAGCKRSMKARVFVLSAGAVNSAVLLLLSACARHPHGLGNSSGQVGRNFMNHNCSALLAVHPFRRNDSIYQKTLQFNDFYLSGGPGGTPLGNIQLLGKITAGILASQTSLPAPVAALVAGRSVGWYAMSEDLPDKRSRVSVDGERIVLAWQRSNWEAHKLLVDKTKKVLRRAGFAVVLSRAFDKRTPSHQCGTARFGRDPRTSVLDTHCRTHDHPNLRVVDASFLPSSAALNPALTIAAQALRVARNLRKEDKQ